jgi:hypothetical protein
MNAMTGAVLYERHTPAYADVRGVTIYHPSKASQALDYGAYKTLDFAVSTGWDEFLDAWLAG